MGPRSNVEILSIFGILIFLTMYNALVFGEMSVLVSDVGAKSNIFQQNVDQANSSMKNMNLPSHVQTKVRTYIVTTQGTKYEQDQLRRFLELLSPSLKEEVSKEIFAKEVMKHYRIRSFVYDHAKNSPEY